MAAYAEGFNILKHANAGTREAQATAEHAPLRDPQYYQFDFDLRGDRRSLAPRQRRLVVAARPDRGGAEQESRPGARSPAASPIRAKAAGRSTRRSTKASRPTCSRPRSSPASAHAAKPISRTGCCRRCASSSAATSSSTDSMSTVRSDAFVFLGATGDLAFKKIFPALQAMIRRGHLDIPIIGVARASSLEKLRQRAHDSLEQHGGGVDRAAFAKLVSLLRYRRRRLRGPDDVRAAAPRARHRRSTRCTTSPSRRACSRSSSARSARAAARAARA